MPTEIRTKQGYFIPSTEDLAFEASMTSSLSNLGSPDVEKLFNHIDINYKGTAKFYLKDESGHIIQSYSLSGVTDSLGALKRNTERLFIKLENRLPIEKMSYKIVTTDREFIFYSIDLDFSVEEKDGGYGDFPTNQTSA